MKEARGRYGKSQKERAMKQLRTEKDTKREAINSEIDESNQRMSFIARANDS